ncbi:MAG: carboxypeptidase regulatory-like domain-containing protein [Bryobacteraceae bacterium]
MQSLRSYFHLTSAFLLVTALFIIPASLHAQAVTGSLLGTVTDASGGAVPGAKVTITETNTGIARTAQTNESGNYAFPALEPGVYRVAVEHTGFRTAVKDGINLLVNTTMRANLELQPGAVTEQITVRAEVPILQTDRSDTGRKIEAAQLENVPLPYGRNYFALLNLVPGTTRAFQPHSEFFNSQGSLGTQVNGVSRIGNNVQFEGVDNNHGTGLLTVLNPPIEALETVDVSTSNYEAELGRAGGAVVNMMLKSGTNDLHGAAYWFHADSALAARETFQPSKPVTTYNQWGFNLGGPIRKNRTFFFGDFLQTKDRRGDSYIISVPTAALRSGDFSSLASRAVIYDPALGNRDTGAGRQPFPGNRIPDARISAISKKILAMTPLPNLGSDIVNNFNGSTTRKKDMDSFDVKVDHQQTPNDRFSVRYSFEKPVVTDPGRFGIVGGGGKGFAGTGVNRTHGAGLNYTHLFSPSFLTEARFGLSRYHNIAETEDAGTNAAEAIGIKGVNMDRWTSGMTSINVGGYANPLVGFASSLPWNRADTNFNFVSNWSKLYRNHTVKFGTDIRRVREEGKWTHLAGGARGEYQFANNQTAIPGSPVLAQANALASFLLDVPSLFQRALPGVFPSRRTTPIFTYVQDKWQATPKLTLDLGLRHDFYPPYTPRLVAGFSNYDFTNNTFVVAGVGGNPMNLGRKTYYTGFAPRAGAAYRIDAKTVIRGGFGISWFPYPDNQYAWDNYPVKDCNIYSALSTYGQALSSPGVYGSMATGYPAPQPAPISSNGIISGGTAYLLSQSVNVVPLDYREGYVETWNFALQRQLPKSFTIEAAYVGNHTVRAPIAYNLNAGMTFNTGAAGRPLYQKFGKNADVLYRYAGYSNNYNSLQVKVDRRYSRGFLMTTAYTYGKALGYAPETGGLWNYLQPRRNYSRLSFDRAHTFVQSYVYELPFGKGKPWLQSGPGRWILGDWQVSGILTLMTGLPLTFGTTVSANTPGSSITPDQTGPIAVRHMVAGPRGSELWFDTSPFRQPLDADGKTPHFGNLGRNNFDGPGLGDLDFSLFRKFQMTERIRGELRFESFNFTNTPAFSNPNTSVGSVDFGKITGTLAGLIANQSVGGVGPRSIQLGLKLSF